MSRNGRGLKPKKQGLLMTEEERERQDRDGHAEEKQVLFALADELGIPESPGRETATLWALARKYVPELKTSRPEGAPTKWDIGAKFVLVQMVARRMRTTGLSRPQACAGLASDDPWLSNVEGKPDGNALVKQCPYERLKVALRERDEAEQVGMIEDLDALIDKGRTLMIEIAAETSFA
jgi:hypothetical protein